MRPAAVVCCVLLVSFLLLGAADASGGATPGQQSASPSTGAQSETRIAGILLGVNQKADPGRRILLIKTRLIGLDGVELRDAEPKGTVILDANLDAPVAATKTDGAGRFEFKAPPPGRYCLGVTSKANGKVSPKDVILLQSVAGTRTTLVFDLQTRQAIDLDKVSRRTQ